MASKETFDHFMGDLLRVSSDLIYREFGNKGIRLSPTVSITKDTNTIHTVNEVQVIVYDMNTSQVNLLSETEAKNHEIFNYSIALNMNNLSNDMELMKGVVDFSLSLEKKLASLSNA